MAHENKYLTFQLDEEEYAMPIMDVKEIIGMMNITHVPRLPDYNKGLINLRGKIIPVTDLRLRLGVEERAYDERTSIIIIELTLEHGPKTIGMVVDEVHEVLSIDEDSLSKPPQSSDASENEYLTAVCNVGERVIMLLDAIKILTPTENKDI